MRVKSHTKLFTRCGLDNYVWDRPTRCNSEVCEVSSKASRVGWLHHIMQPAVEATSLHFTVGGKKGRGIARPILILHTPQWSCATWDGRLFFGAKYKQNRNGDGWIDRWRRLHFVASGDEMLRRGGIRKPVSCWERMTDCSGDYFEENKPEWTYCSYWISMQEEDAGTCWLT